MVWSNLHEYHLISSVVLLNAMDCDIAPPNHSIFVQTIIFVVYVDDNVVTEDDHQGIIQLKAYLSSYFYMKNIGLLRYFL